MGGHDGLPVHHAPSSQSGVLDPNVRILQLERCNRELLDEIKDLVSAGAAALDEYTARLVQCEVTSDTRMY